MGEISESRNGNPLSGVSAMAGIVGVVLIIGGAASMIFALATTLVTVLFIGAILLVAGIVKAVRAISDKALWPDLFVATLYAVTGVMTFARPGVTVVAITAMVTSLYFIAGFTRLFGALAIRYPRWGWSVVGGLISVALGIFLLANLPTASLWLIGTLLGVELMIAGIELLLVGRAGAAVGARIEEFRGGRRAA